MKHRPLATLAGAAALGTTILSATPALASPPSVTSPRCNTVRVTASSTSTGTTYVGSDNDSFFSNLTRGTSETHTVPAGTYSWEAFNDQDFETPPSSGVVTVAPCTSTSPRRPVDGDQDRDGRADVLGIQARTGNLYYYRMTSTGLASGVRAGTGWNNMVFMQQVNEVDGQGSPDILVAVRNDGTVWQYANLGTGRFGSARQIGDGLSGYTNFTVTQPNSELFFGERMLLASDGQVIHAFQLDDGRLDTTNAMSLNESWSTITKTVSVRAFDGDAYSDVISVDGAGTMQAWQANFESPTFDLLHSPRRVGHGWGAMQTVTSPGSVDGDRYSDLVARRSDGNLYKYVNAGGSWRPAVRIGANWQGIRLLA